MLFGKRLRELRKEQGWTQEQLGEMIHVKKPTICKYEKGSRFPDLETLSELTMIFHVDYNTLLGESRYAVAEEDTTYGVMLAKEEVEFIQELRKRKKLYEKICDNPRRMVELLEKKIR